MSDVNVEGEVIFGKLSTLSRKDQMQRCALSDPESCLDRDLIRVRVGIQLLIWVQSSFLLGFLRFLTLLTAPSHDPLTHN